MNLPSLTNGDGRTYFSCAGRGFFNGGPRGVDSNHVVICDHTGQLWNEVHTMHDHNRLRWSSDRIITYDMESRQERITYHVQKNGWVSGEPAPNTEHKQ